MVSKNLIRSFAIFGQYLIPAAFLIGTAVSAIGSRKRNRLLAMTAEATSQGAIKALSWQEFEMLVGEVFRYQGYTVQQTADGADVGVDLELKKDGETQLVQCKQWRATKVGVTTVRELSRFPKLSFSADNYEFAIDRTSCFSILMAFLKR